MRFCLSVYCLLAGFYPIHSYVFRSCFAHRIVQRSDESQLVTHRPWEANRDARGATTLVYETH